MSERELNVKLCAKLPDPIQEIVMGAVSTDQSVDVPFITTFLKNSLPYRNFKAEAINDDYKKSFFLGKTRRKKVHKPPRHKKTALSLREKRELGLYKLRRKGMKYKDFLPLHNLWKEYIISYLDLEQLETLGFTGSPEDRHWENLTRMLLKADYHGAFLTVSKSTCSSLVGKSGIVVFDTKNTFKLIGEDNVIRTIPKESSIFTLKQSGYVFTILGKQFCIRSGERSSKKIRTFMNLDL